MPRGRKKKDTVTIPVLPINEGHDKLMNDVLNEATSKRKGRPISPWAQKEEKETEFSDSVIEKNRKRVRKKVLEIGKEGSGEIQASLLYDSLKTMDGVVFYNESGPNSSFITLYFSKVETDEEVISRLRQKKAELEKLKEELGE